MMSLSSKCVFKNLIALLICFIIITGVVSASPAFALAAENSVNQTADSIIRWKKNNLGLPEEDSLLSSQSLNIAGGAELDWFAFALERSGINCDYTAYAAALENSADKIFSGEENSSYLATDLHRMCLAYYACGGEPSEFNADGDKLDLIAESTYLYENVGRQGINGYIWALITLDARGYETGSSNCREEYITNILSRRLPDGGFALSGDSADPDMTAMALTALAPYYNTLKEFNIGGETVTVKTVADDALKVLSEIQTEEGDFKSWGVANSKSTAWVLIALLTYGIDINSEADYIKNGNTVLDGLLKYRDSDGGFCHSLGSLPDSMSSEQALYAYAALQRFAEGKRFLFDMREEFTASEKEALDSVNESIASLKNGGGEEDVKNIISAVEAVKPYNRRYIRNFWEASRIAADYGLLLPDGKEIFEGDYETRENKNYNFSDENRLAADNIISGAASASEYYKVLELLYILNRAPQTSENTNYIVKLSEKKAAMEEIFAEIDAINYEIKNNLHPLEKLVLSDLKYINGLIERINALSEEDRLSISGCEDVFAAKAKLESRKRSVIIYSAAGFTALICIAAVVIDILKKKKLLAAGSEENEEE